MSEVIRLSIKVLYNEMSTLKEPFALELISVGIKNIDDENDTGYYAVSSEADIERADKEGWMHTGEMDKLFAHDPAESVSKPIQKISEDVFEYVKKQIPENFSKDSRLEIWSTADMNLQFIISRMFNMAYGGNLATAAEAFGLGSCKYSFNYLCDLPYPMDTLTEKPEITGVYGHAFDDACHYADFVKWNSFEFGRMQECHYHHVHTFKQHHYRPPV